MFDDPYAMAVLIAYLQKRFDVVRIKNRFENDEVEEVTAETDDVVMHGDGKDDDEQGEQDEEDADEQDDDAQDEEDAEEQDEQDEQDQQEE